MLMKKVKAMRGVLHIVLSLTALNLGCKQYSNKGCIEDIAEYTGEGKPIIQVDSVDRSHCVNYVTFFYSDTTGRAFGASGEMFLRDDCIYMKLVDPQSSEFCLLDLELEAGREYVSVIDYKAVLPSTRLHVAVEKIIDTGGELVHMVRIKNGFSYEGDFLDIVFFASKRKGVFASYLSILPSEINGREYYINPWGDTLDSLVDFSGKTHRLLE
jgi:hypothetical protein